MAFPSLPLPSLTLAESKHQAYRDQGALAHGTGGEAQEKDASKTKGSNTVTLCKVPVRVCKVWRQVSGRGWRREGGMSLAVSILVEDMSSTKPLSFTILLNNQESGLSKLFFHLSLCDTGMCHTNIIFILGQQPQEVTMLLPYHKLLIFQCVGEFYVNSRKAPK